MDIAERTLPTGSLPSPLTALIGREREIAEVVGLLHRHDVRLVTLTGPGGVGKTRLAIEIAKRIATEFPDGAWFVDLAPVRDAARVIPEIAQVIGIPGRTETIQALLAAQGSEAERLLLIDNFEHVIDSAPAIVALLAGAPGLTVLVTSREPLKVGGEREYPIAPLPVTSPEASNATAPPDAARLFAERAQAALPAFAITPENAAAITEICRRLDGLPLAIELAAVRVKLLPPDRMLARLDQRLPLLSGTRRDLPERQQTMRGAIAWSYDHLSLPEQTFFRRLGVFVGGFPLDAAEAVAAVPGEVEIDLLRDLASLVDKSLVSQEGTAGGEPRYFMLETIREFATEYLRASEESAAIRNAHAEWCARIAVERRLHGDIWTEPPVPGRTAPIVETEYGNIRAALAWLDESGDLGGLARIAGSIWWYWHLRGPRSEGLRWLRRAEAARGDSTADKTSRMWALEGLSLLARNSGALEEATKAGLECQALARELGDALFESTALGILGYTALGQGAYEQAEHLSHQAIEVRERSRLGWNIAFVLPDLGEAAYGRGDRKSARKHFELALEQSQVAERHESLLFVEALVHGFLAILDCDESQYSQAAAHLLEALPIWQRLNNQENLSEWLADVAVLANARGDHDSGARFMGRAIALRDDVGHVFTLPERAVYERAEQSLRAALGPEAFERTSGTGAAIPFQQALADAAAYLNEVGASVTVVAPEHAPNSFGLTRREVDVIRLLTQGKSDREIAEQLYIGTRTVETHVSNLIAKLGVHNRTEAATLATREGLTDH